MDEKQAKFKFYVIADTSSLTPNTPIHIEEHTFDFNNETDKTTAVDYHRDTEELDEETLTVNEFVLGCFDFLMEDVVGEWDQRLCRSMVLTEPQFKLLQNYK